MNLLLYGFLALSILGMIGGGVYKVKQWGGNEVRAEWATANEEARKREAEASAKAAADLAAERAKRKVVIQERTVHVDREVEKPVYRDVCLPATGLCLANAAISGKVSAGCFSDGAVPAVKPSS